MMVDTRHRLQASLVRLQNDAIREGRKQVAAAVIEALIDAGMHSAVDVVRRAVKEAK